MKNVALITGASNGIGLELSRIHASKKADLILVARSTTKLNALKEQLEKDYGVEVLIIPKDLSVPDSAREVYDEIKERNIEVEFLINNAGFGDFGLFHETDWEKEEMMINLNILALTLLTKLFGADMVARRSGKIMNLSSTAAFQPGPLMSVYFATKHFVQAFSEGIANEWEEYGVTVTALCPGPTTSGFQSVANIEDTNIVKGRKLPTSKDVAIFGYDAMMKGKLVAIHGTLNKALAKSVKLLPKRTILKTVRKMQEKN
ncbi:MAG TPA: SDR family NAD(P)-dependent oxidoreductase [Cyclobacteriaceae bacterium]